MEATVIIKFGACAIIGSELLMLIQDYFENQIIHKRTKSNKRTMLYIAILVIIGIVIWYFKKWTTWPYLAGYLAGYVIGTILNYKNAKTTNAAKIIYPIIGIGGFITIFSLLFGQSREILLLKNK